MRSSFATSFAPGRAAGDDEDGGAYVIIVVVLSGSTVLLLATVASIYCFKRHAKLRKVQSRVALRRQASGQGTSQPTQGEAQILHRRNSRSTKGPFKAQVQGQGSLRAQGTLTIDSPNSSTLTTVFHQGFI